MVIPSSADGFRAAHCDPLMGKTALFSTPSRSHMTAVCDYSWRTRVGEWPRSLERSWNPRTFVSRETRSSYPAVATRTPSRTALPHFIVLVARGPDLSKVLSLTNCDLLFSVESYVAPKVLLQCKRCQRFRHTQPNCGYAPRCVACGDSNISADAVPCGNSLRAVAAGRPHREIRWL